MNEIMKNIMMADNSLVDEKIYWQEKLQGEIEMSGFKTDFISNKLESNKRNFKIEVLENKIFERIMNISKKSYHMAYVILISGVNLLMNRYTEDEDIIVGMPGYKDDENEMLVNEIIPVRSQIKEEMKFKDIIISLKNEINNANKNLNIPINKILLEQLGKIEDNSEVFKTIVGLENIHSEEAINKTYSDMKFIFTMDEQLKIKLEYNAELFKGDSIDRILGHLENVYEEVLNKINIEVSQVEILEPEEKEKILVEFNNTRLEYPKNTQIHKLFEDRVKDFPENIAVVYKNEKLTYKELDVRANKLASFLMKKEANGNKMVGIMLEHSLEMIVGVLGILKAGYAYVPIDSSYPNERINYMLEDCNTNILLTQEHLMDKANFSGEIVDINDVQIENETELDNMPDSELAYVIYTSGSTGKPKGVMIEHDALVNLCFWHNEYYGVSENDNSTKYAGFGFDASVWEIFPYLIKGASLHVIDDGIKLDIDRLNDYYEKNNITISFLPTQLCEEFMKIENNSLRYLLTGGDKLKSYQEKNYKLVNNYGPTENTVVTTSFMMDKMYNNIPIGKPIGNTKTYVLDNKMRLLPVGVPGQLCISGDGLAKGYLNRDELTAEKFIDNPFEDGKKLYLSGDLARWLPDGNIEFLGRIDHQVKIRGFRIELGEIESQLMKVEGIEEVVTLDKEDENGDKFLVAYYTAEEELYVGDIKTHLAKELPKYMIPTNIIHLDNMPLTQNGKVDKKDLRNRELKEDTSIVYVEPRNEIEKALCEVLQGVLGIKKIGIDDNFFECGGDSIKSIQIASRLNKYSMKLEIKDLLSNPTVRAAAPFVTKGSIRVVSNDPVIGELGLTPIQKWFFEKDFTDKNHWNQSMFIFRKDGFNEDRIREVFENIVKHHDSLRLVYRTENGVVTQRNRSLEEGKLFSLDVKEVYGADCCKEVIEEAAGEIQKGMDLENGPLVRLGLFKTDEGDHLLIAIHHMVVDGVSWRIILEDFKLGYAQLMKGEQVQFQDKTCSYKQWTEAIEEYSESKELKRQKKYWDKITSDYEPLKGDNHVEDRKIKDSIDMKIELSKKYTKKLLKDANRAYNTEVNDILLTALGMTIKEWRDKSKIIVNMEGHGRENITDGIDVTRTVGWFTSQYPVHLNISEADDISRNIKVIKESIRQIPDKGVGYQVLRNLNNHHSKEGREYESDISFNYLGQFGQDAENDVFGVSQYSAGDHMSLEGEGLSKVSVNGSIMKDELMFMVRYDKHEFDKETMEKFTEIYKTKLENVIDHCSNKKYKELTPNDIGAEDLSIDDFEEICRKYPVENIKSIYGLTPMQEGMLFHYLKNQSGTVYFEQFGIVLSGKSNVDNLTNSFETLIDRYDIFKSVITYENLEKDRQIVFKNVNSEIHYEDLSEMDTKEKQEYIKNFKEKDRQRGFDLFNDKLMRLSILKLDDDKKILVWSFHHIIMDGWCIGLVLNEFFQTYKKLEDGIEISKDNVVDYKKYIDWIERQDKDEARSYWKDYLNGYENVAIVPTTNKEEEEATYNKQEVLFKVNKDLTKKIQKVANKNQVTLNTVFQAVWGVLLQRYNNTEDVVFGTVVSGRPSEIEGIEKMVGLFINTIPVRVKTDESMNMTGLLKEIQAQAITSNNFTYYPLAEIQTASGLGSSLLNHIIAFENYPIEEIDEESKNSDEMQVGLDPDEVFEEINYDFNMMVGPGEEILVRFSFNGNLYNKEFIERIGSHFSMVFEQITEDDGIKIADIDILGEEEKNKIFKEFNDTKIENQENRTITEIFMERAKGNPDKIALKYGEEQITYGELDYKSSIIAKRFMEEGVGAESIIGLMVDRSFEMMIGIMGILKSGAAYLPIDPNYPKDRLEYIIDDSKTKFVLTSSDYVKELEEVAEKDNLKVIDLNCELDCEKQQIDIAKRYKLNDLAYVIYTSGSTGNPKGVLVEHETLINTLNYMEREYSLQEEDSYLLKTTYTFDVSVSEIFGWIFNYGKLVILEKGLEKEPLKILDTIHKYDITHINFVPSMLNAFVSSVDENNLSSFNKLKYIFSAGEALGTELMERFRNLKSDVKLENLYGPTEATIYATRYSSEQFNYQYNSIPIGEPVDNTKAYILDKNNNLQPIGIEGELCLAGEGITRGYLNREDLNNEKFIDDNFATSGKIYKTGDLAKWSSDGNIEYLGRIDHQVKIRGYRIELGEVESAINKYKAIEDNVVIAKKDNLGDSNLTAYLVFKSNIDEIIEGENKGISDEKKVEEWDLVWNNVNPIETEKSDKTFNLLGWNSSYTGESIQENEMKEWVELTVDRLKTFNLKRVLEIGCGTGMYLFRLIDQSEKYTATDISTNILNYVAQVAKSKDTHEKLTLINKGAHDFSKIKDETFDTIIINSVIQYFKDIDYLMNVLDNAINCVGENGVIFLGDIRNYALIEAFHTSVAIYQASDDMSIEELKRLINDKVSMETELLINPEFFHALKNKFSRISHVEIRHKRGDSDNELTRFRYDAILHIGEEREVQEESMKEWDRDLSTIDEINEILREEQPEVLRVSKVTNHKLTRSLKEIEILENYDEIASVKELNSLVEESLNEVDSDVEKFFNVDHLGYEGELLWTGTDDYRYLDLVYVKKNNLLDGNNQAYLNQIQYEVKDDPDWNDYANNQKRAKFLRNIIPDVKEYLNEKLPEYMIPSNYVNIEEIPVTQGGKLDRKKLEAMDYGVRKSNNYVAPRDEAEKKIAEVWETVLGVSKVGIYDDFFDIGGNSIKIIRVVSELSKEFSIEIKDIFEHRNIDQLSKNIDYSKDLLKNRIEDMKKAILEASITESDNQEMPTGDAKDLDEYRNQIDQEFSKVDIEVENKYENVLVTGATGYLGINILHELLQTTDSNLYVLVRGRSDEHCEARLKEKFEYYFMNGIFEKYRGRIRVIKGDISRNHLGIDRNKYNELSENIDCVINSAANVKHYGKYEDFYEINVKSVERIIEFCRYNKVKDLNHISTIGVIAGYNSEENKSIFTEYDYADSDKIDNYYGSTKTIAEDMILEARDNGLNANIYRVGNIVFDSNTGKFQENIENNAFYSVIKAFMNMKAIPSIGIKYDFSFVDYVTASIVKLFDKKNLKNQTYHIFNDKYVDLSHLAKLLSKLNYEVNEKSAIDFLDTLIECYENKKLRDDINNILVNFGLFSSNNNTDKQYAAYNLKTNYLLNNLGFEWDNLNKEHVEKMIGHCEAVGFINNI